MTRMWTAIVAAAVSLGAVTTSLSCADIDPARTAAMMERMHPGFLGGLVDRAGQ